RHRELRKAMRPDASTVGVSSGPGPLVSRVAGPLGIGNAQMLVAPPRFETWMIARPSGENTGSSLKTAAGSFDTRLGAAVPSALAIQISPAMPPEPLTKAMSRPSGDHAGFRVNGEALSTARTSRVSDPSARAVASTCVPASVTRVKAMRLPSGDHV